MLPITHTNEMNNVNGGFAKQKGDSIERSHEYKFSWTKNWYGGCLPRNTDTKEHTEYGGCLPPHTEENTMHKNDHGGCLPHVRNNTSRKKRNRQGKRTRNVKRESSRTRGLASKR